MKKTRIATAALAALAVVPLVGGEASATMPGKNGRITFIRGGDVYTAAANGADVKRLTATAAVESTPKWSPDGKRIAYVSGGYIWTMNADGSGKTKRFRGTGPSWSPDGSRIAYVDETVGYADVDGTILCQYDEVFYRPWTGAGNPVDLDGYNAAAGCSWGLQYRTYGGSTSWSPDGGRVLFAFREDDEAAEDPAWFTFYAMDEASVNGAAVSKALPRWSDDAARTPEVDYAPARDNYVFATNAGTADRAGRVWVYNRSGTYKKQISSDKDVRNPVHSPDGTKVLYAQHTPRQQPRLRQVTLPSSAPTTVLTNASQPDWQRVP